MNTAESNEKSQKEAAYPYYDLEACIQFAANIRQLGGSKDGVKKSLLAKQVGLAESTPSFFQRLSACKVFGIVEGWGAYNLTETGRMFFYPQAENDPQSALLRMLSKPAAFDLIIKRFDGEKLPSTQIMGNIFHQELDIPDSWKDRVAQMFSRSARFVKIIDDNGFLRYDAAMHTGTIETPENPPIPATKPDGFAEIGVKLSAPQTANSGITAWSDGDKIKVQTPLPITKEIWEKLNAYVQILKPKE